jgi:hypothetical protein
MTFLVLLPLLVRLAAAEPSTSELKVLVRTADHKGGTKHSADELTLSIGSARPLHLTGTMDERLPLPGPTFRVGDSRFILLGWSSSGAGMESVHVLLVGVERGSVRALDTLVATTDRFHARLLVRTNPDGSMLIGLPEPLPEPLHDEGDWSLRYGSPGVHRLNMAEIRRLPFQRLESLPRDYVYAPPMFEIRQVARVCWFRVTKAGLLQPAPRS